MEKKKEPRLKAAIERFINYMPKLIGKASKRANIIIIAIGISCAILFYLDILPTYITGTGCIIFLIYIFFAWLAPIIPEEKKKNKQ